MKMIYFNGEQWKPGLLTRGEGTLMARGLGIVSIRLSARGKVREEKNVPDECCKIQNVLDLPPKTRHRRLNSSQIDPDNTIHHTHT